MGSKLIKHYKQETHWQWLGDLAIILIPIIHTGLASAPIPDHFKFWIGFICDVSLVIFKFFAKQQNYNKKNGGRVQS